jgi:hypothetical protein
MAAADLLDLQTKHIVEGLTGAEAVSGGRVSRITECRPWGY